MHEALIKRKRELAAWLRENGNGCEDEQRHLDEGTSERVYWHYGYLMALQDILHQAN